MMNIMNYCFHAERIDQTTQRADISVIASSEEEAWHKAQAEADEGNLDWFEEDLEEGETDLTLESCEDLTEEEVEEYLEYLEEQRKNEEAVEALKQKETCRRRELQTLLESLRTTATEEERASLIDDLERMIL
jgi:hypothetical protein